MNKNYENNNCKNNNNSNNNNYYNNSNNNNKLLRPREAALLLGVTTQTLRRWHKDGVLSVVTTPLGHIRISQSEIDRLMRRKFDTRTTVAVSPEAYEGFGEDTTPAPTQDTSYLASLFKTLDPLDEEAERDANFGYVPRNTNKYGSLQIK